MSTLIAQTKDAQEIRQRVDLLVLCQKDTPLKKVASTGGGEYAGACPFCGGEDRFHVQLQAPPGKKPEGSRWMCRQCSPKWGDVIGYVMARDRCEFLEALEKLGGSSLNSIRVKKVIDQTEEPAIDRMSWIATGLEFVNSALRTSGRTLAKALWNTCGGGVWRRKLCDVGR